MTDKLFLENFYSKTHKLILKSNSCNTSLIVDPFTQVKSAEHMAKFDWIRFCGFSFTPIVKMYKTSIKPLQIQNFPFKNVLSLTMEYRMYLTFLQKLRCLGWFKTSQALHREENKVEFLEWQFHNEKLSFVHKKETEHSFEPSLSIVFSILKCKTLVLKTTMWRTRARHFVDWCRWLRCQIRFFPYPVKSSKHMLLK